MPAQITPDSTLGPHSAQITSTSKPSDTVHRQSFRTPSPRAYARASTDPTSTSGPEPKLKIMKRIIVCCDGTWQDGIVVKERWQYTNVLRLARAFQHVDERFPMPIPQIVFYQSGVGTSDSTISQILDGAVGATLADKVQEAYAFIAHNYQSGDEIHLFGFSRGAYTVRMVAAMIGEIGVLDRTDMDHFAEIFVALQKRGKANDDAEKKALDEQLAPWTQHGSPGKIRANSHEDHFSVQCIGVFDTVGALGLPEELTMHSEKLRTIFGFSDQLLGEHVARAYQALALNENRADFNCGKFDQTDEGRRKRQVLKQCWFSGCHSDIGGGYQEHDLSDITLFWMAANIGDILSLDLKYLKSLPEPHDPWGEQSPHDPVTGIFSLAGTIHRQIPTATDKVTYETIHPSVLKQHVIEPMLVENIRKNPALICPLLPLEEELKVNWHFSPKAPGTEDIKPPEVAHGKNGNTVACGPDDLRKDQKDPATQMTENATRVNHIPTESGEPVFEKSWLAIFHEESSVGPLIDEFLGN